MIGKQLSAGQEPPPRRTGLGAPLVLGIVGAALAVVPVVGVVALPIVIIGLILGILAIREQRHAPVDRGRAIAGTVLSGVGLLLCTGWIGAIAVGIANTDLRTAGTNQAASASPTTAATTQPATPALPLPAAAPPVAASPPPVAIPEPLPLPPAPVLTGPPSLVGVNPTTATVARVVDGDTFETTDGQTVRVLGIDSCEAGTDAGARATSSATAVLFGSLVTLTSEPGVDLDRYGRALRYVSTSSGDLGRYMVVSDHTAVYQGVNDAAGSYVAELLAVDPNGRTCDDAPPPPVIPAPVELEDNDRNRTPKATVPDSSSQSGSAGSSGGGATYYKNCSAARAAGAAPLYAGDPGYAGKLDRDSDGVACE